MMDRCTSESKIYCVGLRLRRSPFGRHESGLLERVRQQVENVADGLQGVWSQLLGLPSNL